MTSPRFELRLTDRFGNRDQKWTEVYGFAREVLAVIGIRCLACGGKLWSAEGSRRIYCDDTCRNRHSTRRKAFRRHLRETGQACPVCNVRMP